MRLSISHDEYVYRGVIGWRAGRFRSVHDGSRYVGGAVVDLGGDQSSVDEATEVKSEDYLKTLGTE